MINDNPLRTTATFYTCGTCNLNCRYCNIDKNPVLGEIDKKLAESFKGDYYFERVKAYFPKRTMLHGVETWGGEPFLHMERLHPLLHKLIEEYPYFDSFYSSTNFSYDSWIDKFFGLMDVFGEYPNRPFRITLQLSVDGPEEINDYNRGAGVTKRCLANFNKLLQEIDNGRLAKNIVIAVALKPTLDLDNIRALQTKEAIVDYFKFFEDNYILPTKNLGHPNIYPCYSIPNTAIPSPVTKHDGQLFANFIKLCREIEQENWTEHYFEFYQAITPFGMQRGCCDCANYQGPLWGCGSGTSSIGFLPDNIVTSCHEGFTEIVEQYKDYAAQRNTDDLVINFNHFIKENRVSLSLTDDQYRLHEQKMSYLIKPNATAQLATTTVQIIALALAGLIDEKYVHEDVAQRAATYFQTNCSYCIKDNYNQTGSYATLHNGLFKLLLNGALDYIYPEQEEAQGACQTC